MKYRVGSPVAERFWLISPSVVTWPLAAVAPTELASSWSLSRVVVVAMSAWQQISEHPRAGSVMWSVQGDR